MDETKTQAAAEELTRQIQIKDVHYISDANICILREKRTGVHVTHQSNCLEEIALISQLVLDTLNLTGRSFN